MLLLCYVLGDDFQRAFEVEIGEEESVSFLKEAIKAESPQTFHEVDAPDLVLWKASVPFNQNLKENVEELSLVDDDALEPFDILSDVFTSGLENKTVHIVVDRPRPGELQALLFTRASLRVP